MEGAEPSEHQYNITLTSDFDLTIQRYASGKLKININHNAYQLPETEPEVTITPVYEPRKPSAKSISSKDKIPPVVSRSAAMSDLQKLGGKITSSEEYCIPIVTHNILKYAIQKRMSQTFKYEDADIDRVVSTVLNLFGTEDQLLDNMINNITVSAYDDENDRNAFYMLEDLEILETEREETTLYDGREWRIHLWRWNRKIIAETLTAKSQQEGPITETVYDRISDDMWDRSEKKEKAAS